MRHYRWLSHVKDVLEHNAENNEQDREISWAAFNASKTEHGPKKPTDKSTLLPLFAEKATSPSMILHSMNIIKQNVSFLNPGQVPVIAFDHPFFALAKQIQWNWPDRYGEDKMDIIFGGLHIEMTALRSIGGWLEESGSTNAWWKQTFHHLEQQIHFLKLPISPEQDMLIR